MKKYLFLFVVFISILSSCNRDTVKIKTPIQINNLSGEYITMCSSIWNSFSKTKTKIDVEQEFIFEEMECIYIDEYLVCFNKTKTDPELIFCIVYKQIDNQYHFYEGALIDDVHNAFDYITLNVGDTLEDVLKIDTATQICEIDGKFYSYHHCENYKTVQVQYTNSDSIYTISEINVFNEDFCFVDCLKELIRG